MKLSGNNVLYLPQVKRFSFTFKDIIVDSFSTYQVYADILFDSGSYYNTNVNVPLAMFVLSNGNVLTEVGKYNIGTYNTGEAFTVSGWYDSLAPKCSFISVGNIPTNFSQTAIDCRIGGLHVNCPTSGSFSSAININGEPITYNLTIPNNFKIGGTITGLLTTNTPSFLFGSDNLFLQSYEQLFASSPVIGAVIDSIPVIFQDNDLSTQSNLVQVITRLNTISGEGPLPFSTFRDFASGAIWSITGDSNPVLFGNDFNGLWSGNNFVYSDTPSYAIFHYHMNLTDALGAFLPKKVSWSLTGDTVTTGTYITGFSLTSTGQYQNPPTLQFTGYYYVTGLQQDLKSMIFSSGCTGNLGVSFTTLGGYGTGASGYLSVSPLLLQNVFTPGINTYYIVNNYTSLNNGTGYTVPPRAFVNTGQYGNTCYDVAQRYGNQAWFYPFTSLGTIDPQASYLTGVPLCTTGIVAGGGTGYTVTGIQIWNIGSGYNTVLFPKIQFIRSGGDVLTSNASGVFLLKQGSTNVMTKIGVDYMVGASDWFSRNYSGGTETIDFNDNDFAFRINISGADTTAPWTGQLFVQYNNGSQLYSGVKDNFIFMHSFSTDPEHLKKNDSVTTGVQFTSNGQLSFLLTQDDLDILYSGPAFTNNTLDVGDLNF